MSTWGESVTDLLYDAGFMVSALDEDGTPVTWVEAPASEIVLVGREALLADDVIERVARELANLDPGDEWPTNEELGGNPFTGTRDDEYRSGMRERAREVLETALGIEGGQ